jgi:hypothetical protein
MDRNGNILPNAKGMNVLESINQGLVVLAEQAMRQGEYVLASKLRNSIAVNQLRIEQLKSVESLCSSKGGFFTVLGH